MSEETMTAPVEAATPVPEGQGTEGLTTQSDELDLLIAQMPNKDAHVPVVDLFFDGQTRVFTVQKYEVIGDDDTGKVIRLGFKLDEGQDPLTSIEGIKKVPGYVWRPRFGSQVTPGKVDDESKDPKGEALKQAERVESGLRDIWNISVAAGVLKKGEDMAGQIAASVKQLEGKKVKIAFTVREGTKRDEDGRRVKFQNTKFSNPTAADGQNGPAPVAGENF